MNSTAQIWLLLANVASTWAMVGLIWIIQIVHYPLFALVGAEGFAAYAHSHQFRITWIVAPLMGVELVTAVLLALYPPIEAQHWWLWLGVGLVAVSWLSTALLSVPQHETLSRGFQQQAFSILVATNWIRTAVWTARGVLMLVVLHAALAPRGD